MNKPNRPEAIECLQSIIDVYEISGDEVLLDEDDIQAIKLAIDSLKTDEAYNLLYEKAEVIEKSKLETIINDTTIQEDVIRYKMLCEVIKHG